MRETVNVYLRLSTWAIEMVEQRAASKRLSRATWLREAILQQLQEEQRQDNLEAMEHRLLAKLEHAISKINAHITTEIDTLTQN